VATSFDILNVTAGTTARPLVIRKELVAVGKVTAGKLTIQTAPTWAQQFSREQQTVADIHGEPAFDEE